MPDHTMHDFNELIAQTATTHPDLTDDEIVTRVLSVVDTPNWHPVMRVLTETEILRQLDEKRLEARDDDH